MQQDVGMGFPQTEEYVNIDWWLLSVWSTLQVGGQLEKPFTPM